MNPTKSIKNLALALTTGVGYLALSSTVPAADSTNKGFLAFDGGVSISEATTFHGVGGNSKVSFDPGFRLDVSGGVDLRSGFALDLDLGLISCPLKQNPLLVEGGSLD